MEDISKALRSAMNEEKCTPLLALFLLIEEDRNHGICILQSESLEEISGGLRGESNGKSY